ncbi:hypothetical protein E2C01_090820 [Portunus trituberculatus]|uniref:Uncharacterized protein n=1 Tax=Portunus trituberculatus TaxID=210409 RepID=A0A5B7JHM2_PORTR|nr:hypothetical protein [Portunus trituberculatus]
MTGCQQRNTSHKPHHATHPLRYITRQRYHCTSNTTHSLWCHNARHRAARYSYFNSLTWTWKTTLHNTQRNNQRYYKVSCIMEQTETY